MNIKIILTTFLCTLLSLGLYAQSGGFLFQGYAIDTKNEPLENTTITARFTIYDNDEPSVNYQEEQTFSTNEFGLFRATVGGGSSFNRLDFSTRSFWMKVEVRKGTGAEPFTTISDAQFATVPYAKSADNGNPIGTITPFAGTTVPDGWLFCDGSEIVRNDYAILFQVVGTVYGAGNGSTTFNLPNLGVRIPVGLHSADTDFDQAGKTGGINTQTLTTAQIPNHSHGSGSLVTSLAGAHNHSYNDKYHPDRPETNEWCRDNDFPGEWRSVSRTTGISGNHTHNFATGTNTTETGSDTSFSIVQPYQALNYIIRVR